jgi:hypothetical protein
VALGISAQPKKPPWNPQTRIPPQKAVTIRLVASFAKMVTSFPLIALGGCLWRSIQIEEQKPLRTTLEQGIDSINSIGWFYFDIWVSLV